VFRSATRIRILNATVRVTDIAYFVRRFWATLREKCRVRIEHPDLPAELQSATGELAAVLWTRAVDMSQEQLAAVRHEAQLAVADAQARQMRAEADRDQLRQELTGSAAALDGAQTRITQLEQALAISIAAASTLQEQVRLAQQGEQQLQRALETTRHEFASELDKLRADGALAQERLKAAETRALLEIDRERQAAARLQKELDAATRKVEQGVSRHRDDVQKLQAQLGNLRQQVVFWRVIWMRCAPRTRVTSMKWRRRVSSETNWRCH
jgi:chromosome segregation ATPase